MQMILVSSIEVRAQYRLEPVAGSAVDRAKEATLIIGTMPAIFNSDPTSVGEDEAGNVDCIGSGML